MRRAPTTDTPVAGLDDALRQLGVSETTLVAREKEALDRQGFVVLREGLDGPSLEPLREAFEAVLAAGAHAGGSSPGGTRHADDLARKHRAFDAIPAHPRVLAAVHHVLRRPFALFQFSGRGPLPGYGQQGLHADWVARAPGEPFAIVTVLWLLDDFTEKGGATRVVPGSHLQPSPPGRSLSAPASRHAQQTLVLAPAGSIVVLNGHLWHSGTRNESGRPRRALQCQYVARERVAPTAPRPHVPESLGPAARALLGG